MGFFFWGVFDGVKEEGCGFLKKIESRRLEGGGRGWSVGFYLKSIYLV